MEEAGNLALWFVANDIGNNPDSPWTKDTRIAKITTLYDETEDPTGYAFEFLTGSNPSGYIVISARSDNSLVQEFSYSAMPLFYEANGSDFEKVFYTAPLEYFVKANGTLLDLNKKKVSSEKIRRRFKSVDGASEKNKELLSKVRGKDHLKIKDVGVQRPNLRSKRLWWNL